MKRRWTRDEEKVVRELAGRKTAAEIALILDRPVNGVHHRIKKLGLRGHIHGEHHWNAKVTQLQADMIGVLRDAGFTATQIKDEFNLELSKAAIEDIGACRTWR